MQIDDKFGNLSKLPTHDIFENDQSSCVREVMICGPRSGSTHAANPVPWQQTPTYIESCLHVSSLRTKKSKHCRRGFRFISSLSVFVGFSKTKEVTLQMKSVRGCVGSTHGHPPSSYHQKQAIWYSRVPAIDRRFGKAASNV